MREACEACKESMATVKIDKRVFCRPCAELILKSKIKKYEKERILYQIDPKFRHMACRMLEEK